MDPRRQTYRGMGRRASICALAVLQLPWRSALAGEAPRQVVVLFASGVEAYAEAVDGLRSGLAVAEALGVAVPWRAPPPELAQAAE